MGKQWNQWQTLPFGAAKSLQMVTAAMKLKALDPWMERYHQHRQHIKKQRYHFVNKVHLFKAIVFPAVTYGCDIWTIKKAEHQIIDAFELWHWRRLLRVPWTSRRSNLGLPHCRQILYCLSHKALKPFNYTLKLSSHSLARTQWL